MRKKNSESIVIPAKVFGVALGWAMGAMALQLLAFYIAWTMAM